MRYMRGLNEWLERDVHDRQAELQAVIARVEQLRHDMRAMPAAGAPAPEPSDSSSSSGSDGSDGVPIVIPGQGPGFVAGQGPPFVPGQGQGPRVVPGQQGAPVVPGWPPLGFQPQHGGGPVIPQHGGEGPGTGVPFIPGNLPPPMQGVPQLYQFPQGPPPIPGIGPGGFVMPQSGPYTAGPPDATIPYIPRFGTGGSPLPGDPLVVPMPMSGRSSSSSGSSETTPRRTRRRPRRDSESGSESTVTGSSPERPIVIHPSTSGMPQQQQGQIPQGQTIIINPSAPAGSTQAPTYIPQVSIPVGSSRHHHSPRSSRSSRSSRSPRTPIQILPSRGHRSRSSRSRSSHRHTPPPPQVHIIQPSGAGPSAVPVGYPGTMPPGGYPGTMPQGPYPGTMPPTMIPTMVPSQAPIFVTGRSGSRSRSSSRGGRHGRRHDSRSRSRSSHGRHSPTVILQQQPPSSMPPMTQGPPIVLGPQGTGQPIVLTRRSHSRSRSRSYSPRQVYVRSHSGSRSGRHRSRSRSPRHGHEQPTIIMQPTTAGMPPMMMPSSRRSRSRSRSPVIITGSRRSRSPTHYDDRHRRRSRSRSRSPRHYPQTPVVVTAGTHRSHRSRSRSRSPRHYPTIIGHSGTHRSRSHRSRSRSRSPRHYPTIIGHSGTHRSRRSRSRSRSRSPRHYPTIIGHSGTHRSRSHRSRSGSRSPRHHSQPPIIMTGTHGTHRSRHSRSRSRSPTHLPTIIGSHHPSHHPSHFARSRSGSPESYRPHASHPSEHHIPIVVPRSGTQRSDTHRSGIHRPRSRSHSPTYIPHDHARSMSGSPSPHGPPRTHTAGSRSPSRHPRRPSRSERPSHSDRPSRSERPAHSERSVSPESPHTRTGSTRPHGSEPLVKLRGELPVVIHRRLFLWITLRTTGQNLPLILLLVVPKPIARDPHLRLIWFVSPVDQLLHMNETRVLFPVPSTKGLDVRKATVGLVPRPQCQFQKRVNRGFSTSTVGP
ncbi:hypothetical protein FB45DRAFT_38349 [Roridomyces roridus]|uniref:Uncharacterized protein n=1 Tax=Roridomyces roridus TaxID=1738132 RepID=A0AAD7BRF1_9AGAR|nr:hypothetical protein FB45DRAFT_38349 [Roridomyces roridus]